MIVRKSVKHHVSMGNFEWVEFGGEVEISSDEFPQAKNLRALEKIADDFLEQSIAADLEEARLNTDEDKSYVHIYKNDEAETK